jgi:class 3 adenylate cyclase/alpha-beta hydrolase superfamily lysophospholipase
MAPTTRYVRSDNASIAYQVVGDGPLDVLFLPGWISQVEQLWELPAQRRFLERLASFGRVILFDRRGTGLSERLVGAYSLEQEVRDALAVLDAASSERAALFTYLLGGLVGSLLAAEHPQRVGALIMYASVARTAWAPDYDWALTVEERQALVERNVASWGELHNPGAATLGPSMAGDPSFVNWLARMQRLAASPSDARTVLQTANDLDVRHALPRVRAPTLVMHRSGEQGWDARHSRYLAEHIPGARYVELEGIDSLPFLGDSEAILEEVEVFLTGQLAAGPTRTLLTVMFTDIVDATGRAAGLGDGRWRDLLADHDQRIRAELDHYDGREVKTVGDGFLATFDGPPSRALRCAQAITRAAGELGVEVRVGMHTGECELVGEHDVAGMAVHIAARVGALAGPGEVLVSGTVFGTVVGGPFVFEDRGSHALKGVPGHWPLFALSG